MYIIRARDRKNTIKTFAFATIDELKWAENFLSAYFYLNWFSAKVADASATKGTILRTNKGDWANSYEGRGPLYGYMDDVRYHLFDNESDAQRMEKEVNSARVNWASDEAIVIHLYGNMWVVKVIEPFTD